MVMKITKMFTERPLYCPEFVASEQAQMTRYLSKLKINIHQFVSTQHYGTLDELQDSTKSQEIMTKIQIREQRQDPV